MTMRSQHFAEFIDIFQSSLDATCKLETPKTTKHTIQNNPWITDSIVAASERKHELKNDWIKMFADDHQIYKSFKPDNEYQVLCSDLPKCFQDIERWMSKHYLQLNPGKTEIIIFGSKKVLSELEINGVFLKPSVCIRTVQVAKNLGFLLDSTLRLDPQIKKLKASVCYKLRNISKMRPFLSEKQLQIITQALVISSLDYCNALYIGANQSI